jgi:peptidoglycan hydrolase CwlO-like protein
MKIQKHFLETTTVSVPPSTTTTTTTTIITTTTTEETSTPGCEDGNLDNRVCRIESEIEEFHGNFQNINEELEELRRQIAELTRSCQHN